jgi:hypothetical protein
MEKRERRSRRENGAHNCNQGSISPVCIVSDDSDNNNDTRVHRKRGCHSVKLFDGEGKWWGEQWAEGKCGDYPQHCSPSMSLLSSLVDSCNRRKMSKKQHNPRKKDSHSPHELRSGCRCDTEMLRWSHSSNDYPQLSKSQGCGHDDSNCKHK